MSAEKKLLELAGFQPIVSEAQAYQITRNFNKSLAKKPYLNKVLTANGLLVMTKKIKVGSYFLYHKFPVKCNAVSKDGIKKEKFASGLFVLSENLATHEVAGVCLRIAHKFNLTGDKTANMWNLVAYKKYDELYEFLEKLCENQKNSTVGA